MTKLEAIIEGLLADRPLTGYEIIKAIGDTPSFGVASTAGSVYPALKRLMQLSHVRSEDASLGGRPASRYHLTPQGLSAFKDWLRSPAGSDEDLLLRMQFPEQMTFAELRSLFASYQGSVAARMSKLDAVKRSWNALPVRQRLPLQNELITAKAQLEWAGLALAQLDAVGPDKSAQLRNWML